MPMTTSEREPVAGRGDTIPRDLAASDLRKITAKDKSWGAEGLYYYLWSLPRLTLA